MSSKYASQQAAGFQNYIRKVAIVGAAGQQGSHIVTELLKTGKHTVTAITREDSTNATFATGVNVVKIDYDNQESIVSALTGQDALIITMSVRAPKDTHTKLIEGAAKAGVHWIVPDEWGFDSNDTQFGKDTFLGPPKLANRQLIEKLRVSSWTGVACGFWYEYSLGTMQDMYGFDFQSKSVIFYDDGKQKVSTSTWEQVARATAGLMQMKIFPEDESDTSPSLDRDFRNKFAFVSSFCVNQKDMFESVKRVTGDSDDDWKISYVNSKDRYTDALKQFSAGDWLVYAKLLYTRCFYPGDEANFEVKHSLVNEMFGLPKEDLDACTKKAIERSNEIAEKSKK